MLIIYQIKHLNWHFQLILESTVHLAVNHMLLLAIVSRNYMLSI
jgi:hypothetical protein